MFFKTKLTDAKQIYFAGDNGIKYLPNDFGKVAVLYGGKTAEREISLMSGKQVFQALKEASLNVTAIDVDENLAQTLRAGNYTRAFNVLHGSNGEDGVISGLLDALEIPYPGSGVLGSAISMDKIRSKLIWQALGLPTPAFIEYDPAADLKQQIAKLKFPLCIKPIYEGSSIGVSRCNEFNELPAAIDKAKDLGPIMIENWIEGSEFSVGIVNGQALPPVEIKVFDEFYDFESKYVSADTNYICPCDLDAGAEQELQELALRSFNAVGCKGWGRVDFMRDAAGNWQLLEVNPIPGMTSHSLVPKEAAAIGLSFQDLVISILASSLD